MYYNKDKNLVHVSNSILKHFGVSTFHDSLKELDDLLSKKTYDNVALILFDGLGKYIQEKHLSEKDIIRRNKFMDITSVFPPTTVAATTALLSGRYPKETGRLGWSQYYKNIDKTIDMFSGRDSFKNTIIYNRIKFINNLFTVS